MCRAYGALHLFPIDTHGFRRGLALCRAYCAGFNSAGFSLRRRGDADEARWLCVRDFAYIRQDG